MEKKKIINHEEGFLYAAAGKKAVVIAFFIVFNIVFNAVNISSLSAIKNIGFSESSKVAITTELEKVYSVMDMPIKIVNKLIKNSKIQTDAKEESGRLISESLYAVILPNNEENGRETIKALCAAGAGISKALSKTLCARWDLFYESKPRLTPEIYFGHKTEIILKMLGTVLPRGIGDSQTKKINNIGVARPAYINVVGFFHL
ncbi:MAG: hypothetical protein LBQ47_06980 [Endomicrobium sp.]|jgi:hypothetical protein|nr:hypothetical protein [Endomicrobium sp.]